MTTLLTSKKVAIAGLIAVVAIVVYLVTSTGGDGAKASLKLNPANGNAAATAATLDAKDLSGGAWKENKNTSDYLFNGDYTLFFDDNADCNQLTKVHQDFNKAMSQQTAGRNERLLLNDSIKTDLQELVQVYRDPSAMAKAFEPLLAAFRSKGFENCIAAEILETYDIDDVVRPVPASIPAPNGGVAKAFNIEYRAGNTKGMDREEYFYWRDGNVVVMLTTGGPGKAMTKEYVGSVITAAQRKIDAAATAK